MGWFVLFVGCLFIGVWVLAGMLLIDLVGLLLCLGCWVGVCDLLLICWLDWFALV